MLLIFTTLVKGQSDSVIKINPTLYEVTGLGGNITVKVTEKGIVVIDAAETLDKGLRLQKIIAGISNKPVTHLILTHYHYDHTDGMATFPKGIIILAQAGLSEIFKNNEKLLLKSIEDGKSKIDGLNKELKALKASDSKRAKIDSALQAENKSLAALKAKKVIYPTQVYDKELSLILGKDTMILSYSGPGHTNSDTWVLFKNDNAITLGDLLFTNSMPYIDDNVGANTLNWANFLNSLSEKNYSVFISGHGKLAKSEDLKRFASYLLDLRKAVGEEIKKGTSLEEAKKTVNLAAYQDFGFQFFKEQNIEAVYKELSKK
jgi:glyoxylase-like metal-dependent hydrolase (beta-lactamase superfamily II)